MKKQFYSRSIIVKTLVLITLLFSSISARVEIKNMPDGDRYSYTIDEIVTIKAVIISDNEEQISKEIMFPRSPDYKIIRQKFAGTTSNTSISYINGQMTKKINNNSIYYIQLKFNKKGIFTVKSPKIKYKDREIVGNSLKISIGKKEVTKEDEEETTPKFWFYIKSSKVHSNIGEQIILTMEFGQRSDVQLSQLTLPDLKKVKKELSKKFMVKELFKDNKDIEKSLKQQTRNGALYNLYKLKYVLYPFTKGSINIGPFDVNYAVIERNKRSRSNDPFNMFFSRGQERKAVQESNLWSIHITERDYTAGTYKLKHNYSVDSILVGEPITIDVSISGKGNIKSLEIPDYSDSKDFMAYSPEVSYKDTETTTYVTNKMNIKFILVPKFIGNFEIPEKVIKYYNTKKKRVDSLIIKPKKIKVSSNPNQVGKTVGKTVGLDGTRGGSSGLQGATTVTSEKEIAYIQKNIDIKRYKILDFITSKFTILSLVGLNILILLWSIIIAYITNFLSRSKKAKLLANISNKANTDKLKSLTTDYLVERSSNKFKGISVDEIKFLARSLDFTNLEEIVTLLEKFENDKYAYNSIDSKILKDYIKASEFKKKIITLDKDEKWKNL